MEYNLDSDRVIPFASGSEGIAASIQSSTPRTSVVEEEDPNSSIKNQNDRGDKGGTDRYSYGYKARMEYVPPADSPRQNKRDIKNGSDGDAVEQDSKPGRKMKSKQENGWVDGTNTEGPVSNNDQNVSRNRSDSPQPKRVASYSQSGGLEEDANYSNPSQGDISPDPSSSKGRKYQEEIGDTQNKSSGNRKKKTKETEQDEVVSNRFNARHL